MVVHRIIRICDICACIHIIDMVFFRSDPQSLRTQSSDTQVVPDSGEEVILTDCVVPISKLNLGTKLDNPALASCHFGGNFDPSPLGSYFLNSDVSVTQLLPGHHSRSSSIGKSSYMSHSLLERTPQNLLFPRQASSVACHPLHQPSIDDSSVTHTALQFESPHRRTALFQPHTENDRYMLPSSNSPRHAISTEHLNVLSRLTMSDAETQRVRRNSSGSESRVRRHSAAPFRISSHMQRQRRRSHDVRDEQVDLLERLHVAATRRRSFSSPFQTSTRTQSSHTSTNFRT